MRKAIGTCCAAVLALMTQPIEANDTIWQVPTYAVLPSASGLGRPVLTQADGTSRLVFGASWSGLKPGGYADRAPIALAVDPRDGRSLWQRDLSSECSQGLRGYRAILQFTVALPGGDVGMAVRGAYNWVAPGEWRMASSTCFVRLSGSDGRVLWTRNERASSLNDPDFEVASLTAAGADLVAFGRYGDRIRTMRVSGADGSLGWAADDRIGSYWYPRDMLAFDAAAGEVVVLIAAPRDKEPRTELVGLDAESGRERWRRIVCERGSFDARLNAIVGGSVAFATACAESPAHTLTFGRSGKDGLFQLPTKDSPRLLGYDFDETGNLYVAGELRIGNAAAALARFSTLDGRQHWSVPGRLGGKDTGSSDLTTLNLLVREGSVYVWEMTGYELSWYADTSRLSRYDAATGRLLGTRNVMEADHDNLQRESYLTALPGGGVNLAAFADARENNWLWLARASAAPSLDWIRRERLDAAQPGHAAIPYTYFRSPTALLTTSGTPAVVVAGHATTDSNSMLFGGVPFLARIAQDDGHVLREWQRPSPLGLPASWASLSSLATDGADGAYVAGWAESAFVTAVDLSTATTRWEQPFSATMLVAGAAETLYAVSKGRVRRLSPRDGNTLWQVDLPAADDLYDDAIGAVDAVGNPVFSILTSDGRQGAQVIKLRISDGAVLWQWRYPDLDIKSAPSHMKILPDGDVVLTRPFTRLNGDTGAVIWQQSDLRGAQLLQGTDGRLVVGDARKTGANAESDIPAQVARLDPATGNTLWSVPHPMPSNPYSPMALDPKGDVLVATGLSDGFEIVRISGVDGSLLEKKTIAANYNGWEPPSAILVAADGSVFVVADVYDDAYALSITKVFKLEGTGGAPSTHGRSGERPLPRLLRERPRPPPRRPMR